MVFLMKSVWNVLHVDQLFLLTTEVLLVLPHLVGTALPVRDRLPLALEITPKRVDALMEVSDPVVEAGKLALQLVDLVARILVLVVQVLVLVAETLILVTQSVRVVGLVFVSLAWSKMKAAEILTGGCERHLRVSVLLLYFWRVCWRMKEREASCRVRCAFKSTSAKVHTADEGAYFDPSTFKRPEVPTLPGQRGASGRVVRLSLAFKSITEVLTGPGDC